MKQQQLSLPIPVHTTAIGRRLSTSDNEDAATGASEVLNFKDFLTQKQQPHVVDAVKCARWLQKSDFNSEGA